MVEKAHPPQKNTKKGQKDFTGVVPKPLDPNSITHYKTIDSLLTQTPEIVYSEKLDEIIVSGFMRRDDNYQIKIFDGKTFTLKDSKDAHRAPIHKMVLLPEEMIATVSADKFVKIWRISQLGLLHEFRLKYEPLDVCVNPGLMAAVIVGRSGMISCYSIKTGSFVAEINGSNAEGYNACVLLPEKNVVAVSLINRNEVDIIDCDLSIRVSTLEGGNDINIAIGLQMVGTDRIVVGSDNGIVVWSLADTKNPQKLLHFAPPLTKISHFLVVPEDDTLILTQKSPSISFFRFSDTTFLKSLPTKLQKCHGITYARAVQRILVVDSEEGAVAVFIKKEKTNKNACQACNIF